MASRKRLIDEGTALQALAALAQAQRLRAFRALVTTGPEGMTPGLLATRLGVGASVLSFHLKELTHAGLISSEARGRNLIYRARFDHMNALLAYLTEHCCQGMGCEPTVTRSNCVPC
jgi:ArsR family transcriptional regulator, arsenate/arsenite/antimonite-responsive transcriptional repressor